MSPERKETPLVIRRTLLGISLAAAALAAAAQEPEEPPLIEPEALAVLRADPLVSPGDVEATPERLFLGSCSACHGTDRVGNGEPERLTTVILHGVHRGEAGNISMPGFEHSMTDEQVADLVAYLSEATTGTPVDVSTEAVAQARAEQEPILKSLDE